jgi:hypothetical protein
MAFLFPKSFPFCIPPQEETQDIDVGSGTNYPIGMSLTDAMALYWKSRVFACSASAFASGTIVDVVTASMNYSSSGNLALNGNILWPIKMSEMICGSARYFGIGTGAGSITSTLDTSFTLQGAQTQLNFFGLYGESLILRNGAYYPYIGFEINYFEYGSISGFSYALTCSIFGYGGATKVNNSFTLKINNTEYKTDLFVILDISGAPRVQQSVSASVLIEGNNDRLAE